MTSKERRITFLVITFIAFIIMTFCFAMGYNKTGGLIVFPAALLIRYLVTRDKKLN